MMRVVITSGGTEEPLDGVRYITNFSTGATGAGLAAYFCRHGAEVILLHGYRSVTPEPHPRLRCLHYRSFSDLDSGLRQVLADEEDIDAVIHLAAVSDFSPVSIELPDGREIPAGSDGKLPSDVSSLNIRMVRNHKILQRIRSYAAPRRITLVGFKLTNSAVEAQRNSAVRKILEDTDLDFLIHNDLSEITETTHRFAMHTGTGDIVARCETKAELYGELFRALSAREEE